MTDIRHININIIERIVTMKSGGNGHDKHQGDGDQQHNHAASLASGHIQQTFHISRDKNTPKKRFAVTWASKNGETTIFSCKKPCKPKSLLTFAHRKNNILDNNES